MKPSARPMMQSAFPQTLSTRWPFMRPWKCWRTARPMRGSTRIQQVNPTYGEGYAIVAHHLVLNRRYEDAVAYYRKAIAADPQLWSARSELGINLMRLGQEDEPRKQLEMCLPATATATKRRSTACACSTATRISYRSSDADHHHQAPQEGSRPSASVFEDVLKRAIATYDKKYKMTLPGPVQVEVYPDHEDFAVRTMGMPGLGALGVTFGEVVAMDSPSARKPGDFNWASTLWHEMSHVFILTRDQSSRAALVYRGPGRARGNAGFTGVGRPITPDIVVALRDKKLLPVADLDRGFVRPEYPSQVIVSYYQAGRICDYIQERWGADKLLDMVHSFAQADNTPEVIQEDLGMTPGRIRQSSSMEWLYKDVGQIAANFDRLAHKA